ncbi:MAG: hypothetical protein RDV41_00185 [Planctomycetota bacterium]|nr:hypothetical protein [Planctomycetota bacterium]
MRRERACNSRTAPGASRPWVPVVVIAVVLIAVFIGREILKSNGETGPQPAKGTTPAASEGGSVAVKPVVKEDPAPEPDELVTEGCLPGGRKVTLVMRNASGRRRSTDPSARPYPFAIPEAQRKTWQTLKTTMMTLGFNDVNFTELIAWLTKETGIVIQMDPAIAEKYANRILAVDFFGTELGLCLEYLSEFLGLQMTVSEDGRIVITESAQEISANFRLQQELWTLAQQGQQQVVDWNDPDNRFADLEVDWSGQGRNAGPGDKVSLTDAVEVLKEITGLNVWVDQGTIPQEMIDGAQVQLPPKHTSATAAASSMARAAGLECVFRKGFITFTTREKAAKDKEELERLIRESEERRVKIEAILSKVVSIEFKGAPMWEVIPQLESAVGMPVIADEDTWFSNRLVTIEQGNHAVRALLEEIGSKADVKWFVEPAAIYLVGE